jgi:hypothetical protein
MSPCHTPCGPSRRICTRYWPAGSRESVGLEPALVGLLPVAIGLLGLRLGRVWGRERSRVQRQRRYQAGSKPELTHDRPPQKPLPALTGGAWGLSKDCSFRRIIKTSRQLAPVDQYPHIPAQSSRRRLDPVLCGCDPTARLDPTWLARLADTRLISHSDQRREKATTRRGALPRGPCSPVGIRCLVVCVLRAGGDLESSGVHRLLSAGH